MEKIKGITVLINDNKDELNYTNLDKIEQLTLTIANETRANRLALLERELDEIRDGLFLDLLQEFSEEDSIRIAEIIAGW